MRKLRILAIEDDALILGAYEKQLREYGIEFRGASTPTEAVILLTDGYFDAAIVDYNLGDYGDSRPLIPAIMRACDGPIIAASSDADCRAELVRLGCTVAKNKPNVIGFLIDHFKLA